MMLAQLKAEGLLLTSENEAQEMFDSQAFMPTVAMRIILFLGAFFASLLLFVFVVVTSRLYAAESFLPFAAFFIVFAVLSLAITHSYEEKKHVFATYVSLCFMVMAKMMIGVYILLHSTRSGFARDIHTSLLIFALFSVVFSYLCYKNTIERFLSSVFLFTVLIYYVAAENYIYDNLTYIMPIVMNSVIALILIGFTLPQLKAKFRPLLFGAIFALVFFYSSTYQYLLGFQPFHFRMQFPFFISLFLAICMTYLSFLISRRNIEITALTAITLVFIAHFCPPHLLFALFLIILGRYSYERTIYLTGILLLPLFIFTYYYDLALDLYHKSLFLMVTGVILICASLFVRFHYLKGEAL